MVEIINALNTLSMPGAIGLSALCASISYVIVSFFKAMD